MPIWCSASTRWAYSRLRRRSPIIRFGPARCRYSHHGWSKGRAVANVFVLPHVFESEIAVRTDLLGALPANVPPNSFPTAIRWRIHQDLGFPRVPFKVFRRPFGFAVGRTVLNIPVTTIAGGTVLEWGRIPLMEVQF